ncbi:hypothetical protein ABH897_002860 [Paenibacillus sp. RC73]|uniref:hypothetical protein n=1 Tax=unclassified Paenibacillus TaxID=185978 RepID=UPI0024BA5B4B|nr:hypothetical protein [Paenibacillus sp. RC343]
MINWLQSGAIESSHEMGEILERVLNNNAIEPTISSFGVYSNLPRVHMVMLGADKSLQHDFAVASLLCATNAFTPISIAPFLA